MHPQQLKKRASRSISSRIPDRISTRPNSYLKTRIRGSQLQNAARILVLVELTQTLHQAYRFAYDKHASDQLLPQNPGQTNQPANPLPFDSCAEFATSLAGIATDALLTGHVKGYGQRLTARLWGSDLAKLAYSGYERHIHNAFEGFKPELVSAGENSPQGPQGAGVYGHLCFHLVCDSSRTVVIREELPLTILIDLRIGPKRGPEILSILRRGQETLLDEL